MVIVYKSQTGFTQQYAQLLGEAEHMQVLSLKQAEKTLPAGTPVLFLGPLAAGRIVGLSRARKRFALQGVCGVGMSLPTPQLPDQLRRANKLGELPVFYLQGGWAPDKVDPVTRTMVNLVTRSTRKALQAKGSARTPQEESLLELMVHGGSRVSLDHLDLVRIWLSKQ